MVPVCFWHFSDPFSPGYPTDIITHWMYTFKQVYDTYCTDVSETDTHLPDDVLPSYLLWEYRIELAVQWRHNGHDSVSNHQPHDRLLNRLFRRRSKKMSNSASLAFVRGIHRRPVNSPHKWPVTRKTSVSIGRRHHGFYGTPLYRVDIPY